MSITKIQKDNWWRVDNSFNAVSYFIFVIVSLFLSFVFILLSQRFYYKFSISSIILYFNIISISYIVYYFFRIYHSYKFHQKYTNQGTLKKLLNKYYKSNYKVGIVVPFFNEDRRILEKTVHSLVKQSHKNIIIVVLNDGSASTFNYTKFFNNLRFKYKLNKKLIYLEFKENRGKRHVMYDGFKFLLTREVDFIVTVDSDTELHKDAIRNLVATIASDSKLGSVTGHVLSKYTRVGNLMQKLIAVRYLTAFNFERAAQANYGGINCNSGPLTIYRAELIKNIMEPFIKQQFMNVFTTYGDDRHLTNLVLLEGYNTSYQPFAFAFTDTPNRLDEYLKQQFRWSKSYIRELLWQAGLLHRHSFWFILDYLMHLLLPMFLLYNFLGNIALIIYILYVLMVPNMSEMPIIQSIISSLIIFFIMLILAALVRALYLDLFIRNKIPSKYNPTRRDIYMYTIFYMLFYLFLF